MRRVVVVGASAAGLTAAEALRRAGHDGPLTLIGDEPHAPYDRPPLSHQILSGAWPAGRLPLRRAEDLDALDLDLRLGTAATGLDLAGRAVRLADGSRVPYDGLIVATGVRPRRLPGEGVVHRAQHVDDALAGQPP
ncbi:FAD-dependent oxidoreductase, partial [Streptomyces prasinus]|uniref:FAD-dependent oxidoreductase n=1 Tax=Streptomyces prasinus TaxID=67345 RepID=UPI00197D747B